MFNYLYIPELRCNLKCKYCYVKNQYDLNVTTKSNVSEDLSVIEESFKDSDYKGIPIIHGGEPLLLEIDELEEIIVRLGKISDRGSVGIQSNLTLLNDSHVDLFHRQSKYLSDETLISTSLEFPRDVHNKYRSNSYDKVMEGMIRLIDEGFNFSVIHTFHKDVVKNLDKFHLEFMEFRKNFPTSYSKFNLIHCADKELLNKYVLDEKDQIKLADYISEYELWEEAGIEKRISKKGHTGCIEAEFCHVPSFRSGMWGFCHRMSIPEQNPVGLIIRPIKKQLHADCEVCEFVDQCHSGCPVEKQGTGKNKKWIFCTFRKRLLSNYKQKGITNE